MLEKGSIQTQDTTPACAVVQGETDFSADNKHQKKAKERLRGNKAELSWLMRTSYISNETENRRQQGAPSAKPSGEEEVELNVDVDEAHYQAVQVMILEQCKPSSNRCPRIGLALFCWLLGPRIGLALFCWLLGGV